METARIFTVPALACGVTEIAGRQAIWASLRITAVIGLRRAGIGHVHELRAGLDRDRFHREMRQRAVADRSEIVFAGIVLQQRDKLRDGIDAEAGLTASTLGCVTSWVIGAMSL